MPIYEYESASEKPCDECRELFEVFQSMREAALTECPYCGESVRRVISGFLVGKGDQLAPSKLERAGFTQYVRKGKGYYEKTAGPGPNAIADGGA